MGLLEVKLIQLDLQVFNFLTSSESIAISQLPLNYYPVLAPVYSFCFQESVILCIHWFLSFLGSGLPCNLNSLMALRRVVDWSFSASFLVGMLLFFEDGNDDFQALYICNQKLEVSIIRI